MSALNEKNEHTEKIIHLMVTTLCDRNCKHCCNKQYDIDSIPTVTDEELRNAEIICLTGGEPFEYSNPSEIARYLKFRYSNIKKVYVYTNATELEYYLLFEKRELDFLDGVNISIKNNIDEHCYREFLKNDAEVKRLSKGNRLYVFDNLYEGDGTDPAVVIQREWQKEFVPADDSIFRRL